MSIIIDGTSGISTAGGTPIVNTTTNPTALGTVTSITSIGNVSVTAAGYGIAFPDASLQTTVGYTGFRNRIINGNMVIDQRNSGAQITAANLTNGTYMVDRWQWQASQAAKFTAQQNAGSVTTAVGFPNYLGMTVATAVTVGAGDFFLIGQLIEGFNFADFAWGTANAKTVTLSFVVYSSLTGTFGGALRNSASTRSYPFTYSIPTANTWTTISVTIAGDTSGTWVGATNGIGVSLFFGLGVGTTFSGTAGAWAASNYVSATGATSVVGTNGATFYITGVQLEQGSVATRFEFRQFGTELALCQRYYYRITSQAAGDYFVITAFAIGTTQAFGFSTFPVQMRTKPTALEQSGTATDYNVVRCGAGTNTNCSAVPTFGIANLNNAETVFTVASGLVNGGAGAIQSNNTSAYLAWSAEL